MLPLFILVLGGEYEIASMHCTSVVASDVVDTSMHCTSVVASDVVDMSIHHCASVVASDARGENCFKEHFLMVIWTCCTLGPGFLGWNFLMENVYSVGFGWWQSKEICWNFYYHLQLANLVPSV